MSTTMSTASLKCGPDLQVPNTDQSHCNGDDNNSFSDGDHFDIHRDRNNQEMNDDEQQLTFISNKTFPLDPHCHHNLIRTPSTPTPPPIENIIPSALFDHRSNATTTCPMDPLHDQDDEHHKLSSTNVLRPPPPSPLTPPLYHHHPNHSRASFQSFQSMPIARFEEHGEDICCIGSDSAVHAQNSMFDVENLNIDDSTLPPPPYHRFETSTSSITHVDSNQLSFDYIDSTTPPIPVQNDQNSTVTIHSSTLIRQQSHSTNDLMRPPPDFDQLFSEGGVSAVESNDHSKQLTRPATPTPYARLIHFKQHQQHLMAPSPTSSLLRRRQSLPPRPSTTFLNQQSILNNQQQPELAGQSSQAMTSKSSAITPFPLISSKEKRIGHRRVNEEGQVTYKKIKSTQLMYSIQLGIGYSVGSMASKPERDLLMRDFMQIETVHFPKSGSQVTPAHHYTDFTFSTYTPFAFRYFRDLFRIQPDDFMLSITNESLQELSNPGASGSMFFRTRDDQFIIKTVEKTEAKFLLKLLPGYYMNLSQNPHTLLPKFFGLYCYECIGKNIRILVMNNLLPSNIKIHQKYDLKGSTYKRRANAEELKKSSPTFKDLDFLEYYYNDENKTLITHFIKMADLQITNGDLKTFPTEGGLLLEAHVYDELIGTLMRDCRVLQSFEIMDYSLLIGVHNYDRALKENMGIKTFEYDNDDELPPGAIRAMNRKGERLLLFMGIIDILQSYRLVKKVEHAWKSILYDGSAISVTKPDFYAKRFLDFMCKKIFGRLPSSDPHPSSSESNYYRYTMNNRGYATGVGNHYFMGGSCGYSFSR